jgi:polysaccharide export outer membrane protein
VLLRGCSAAFLGGVLSCLAASTAVGQAKAPDQEDFRIGPEDTLVISVWQNADLSRIVPVRPDGKISLPLVDEVVAAGLTPVQLGDALKKKLGEYVPNAVVNVLVQEVNSYKVSVIGKVQRPDRYKLRSPTTVLEILALAGGFQVDASTDDIVVLRPEPFPVKTRGTGKIFRRIRFNYKKVISTGGETENFSLQAGDIVVVQ